MRVRSFVCVLAVALSACGVASGARAQGATPARVAEVRWDARLAVQPVPSWAPGATRLVPPGRGTHSAQDTLPRGVSGAELVLGVAGAAAGMWGGALAGLAVYDMRRPCATGCSGGTTSGCATSCENGGLGEGVIGIVAGSIVGTAIGTHFGAKLAHGRAGSFVHRLLGAGFGFLAGLGAFALFGNDGDNTLPLIAFPVAQGVVGALIGHQE